MSHVDLEEIKASGVGSVCGSDELVPDRVHLRAVDLLWDRAVRSKYGIGDGATSSHGSCSGTWSPSHSSFVAPLRPLWPSWQPIRACPCAWTKSTIRRQPGTWSSSYRPAHPGVDPTILGYRAQHPRSSRGRHHRSHGCRGEQGGSRRPCRRRRRTCPSARPPLDLQARGPVGGTGRTSVAAALHRQPTPPAAANARSTVSMNRGSRIRRLAYVIRRLRVNRLNANSSASWPT